ncbi:ABC transporter substrate-binding protein [Myxococcota bacterium]
MTIEICMVLTVLTSSESVGGPPKDSHHPVVATEQTDGSDSLAIRATRSLFEVCRDAPDSHVPVADGPLARFFDFAAVADAAIALDRRAFSARQMKRYRRLFVGVLGRSICGRCLCRAIASGPVQLQIVPREKTATGVRIVSAPPDATDVELVWTIESPSKVADLLIDGFSTAMAYQKQFHVLIKDRGVEDLLRRLESRLSNPKVGHASMDPTAGYDEMVERTSDFCLMLPGWMSTRPVAQ